MSRKIGLLALASFLLLLCSGLSLAQSSSTTTPPAQARPGGRGGNGEPCWQQAGIQKSVMEQRWSIERETRSQIESVCSNSSLTPQQKHQQAHEIREQGRQKIEGLVTPEQETTLTACQQQRGMNHPGGGGGQGMGGGCGEWQHNGGAGGNPNGAPGGGNGNGSGNGNPPPPSSVPKS
jgi:Spy/CpxP family protein refolding chaperone